MRFRTSDKKTKQKLHGETIDVEIIKHEPKDYNFTIRTIKTFRPDSLSNIAIFFIHGAPGSSNAFYDYLGDSLLLSKAVLYSIDRPGYGYSNFGKSLVEIDEQAKIINDIIEATVQEKNIVVVGHSFGGPIAAYIAYINPRVKHLMMLAPANDPENEKIFWISNFAKWKATRWAIPKSLQVTTDEKFAHASELKKIEYIWPQIGINSTHIHGKKDKLVPFVNLKYTRERMQNKYLNEVVFEDENHFIPWTKKEFIRNELITISDSITRR